MNTQIVFSLIIPNWNRRDELHRLLSSVMRQNFSSYEIIVIDNASTDESCKMLEQEFAQTVLIKNFENKGACTARNQGINQARGKYIWFLDSDTEFASPDVMQHAQKLLEKHPDTGSLGAEIFPPAPPAQKTATLCVKNLLPNWEVTNHLQKNGSICMRECDFLPTCNCIVPKKLMLKTGGFDPDYFIMSEDQELGFKINKLGYKNFFDSQINVYHHLSVNARKADLYLKSKNRIRSVIINAPVKNIILLPYYDIKTMLGKTAGQEFLNAANNPNVQKYMKGLKKHLFSKGKAGQKTAMGLLAIEFAVDLLKAYAVNLFTLPAILKRRKHKLNHLTAHPALTTNEQ